MFSVVLYDDKHMIYVNLHQFTFYFSTCIGDLEDLKEDLELLFKFKEDLEQIGKKVEKSLKRSERKEVHSTHLSPERRPAPELSSYFTPPRNETHRLVLPTSNNIILTKAEGLNRSTHGYTFKYSSR